MKTKSKYNTKTSIDTAQNKVRLDSEDKNGVSVKPKSNGKGKQTDSIQRSIKTKMESAGRPTR